MDKEQLAELEAATAAAKQAAEEAGGRDEALNKALTDAQAKLEAAKAPSHDPVKDELAKQQERKSRSEKEKAEFSLRKTAERLKALGGDPSEILGVEQPENDDVPEWYKREQAREGQKTALQLADQLQDESEKGLVKAYLESRIVPSGDPQEDFRLALSAVHALRNKQIAEEVSRRVGPTRTAAGGSQPVKIEDAFEPTPEEAVFMRPPYNLTKEKILAARKKG